jgi:hypothetical protein
MADHKPTGAGVAGSIARRIFAAFVLGFVVSACLFIAVRTTFTLVGAGVHRSIDRQELERSLRRYTDAFRWVDGTMQPVRSRHPLIRVFGIVIAFYVAAFAAAALSWRILRPSIRRLGRAMLGLAAALLAAVVLAGALKPYQRERIIIFLNPERDPYGSGYSVTPLGRREPLLPPWRRTALAGAAGAMVAVIACGARTRRVP